MTFFIFFTIIGAIVLACLNFFDRKDWKKEKEKLEKENKILKNSPDYQNCGFFSSIRATVRNNEVAIDRIEHRLMSKESYIISLFWGALSGISIWLILAIMALIFCPQEEHSYNFNIYALEDSHTTYIRRYSSEEELKYYFSRLEKDGYTIGWIPADQTHIKYSDEQPNIKVTYDWYRENFIADGFGISHESNWSSKSKYIITIPEGTITDNYNIDLQ